MATFVNCLHKRNDIIYIYGRFNIFIQSLKFVELVIKPTKRCPK